MIRMISTLCLSLLGTLSAQAHNLDLNYQHKPALVDLTMMKALNIPILYADETTNVGFTYLTPKMEASLSKGAHSLGHCGNFEALPETGPGAGSGSDAINPMSPARFENMISSLRNNVLKEQSLLRAPIKFPDIGTENPELRAAIDEISEANLMATVQWLSGYNSRYHKAANPNEHVEAMKTRIQAMLANTRNPWKIDLISHRSTAQKSIRVSFVGSTYPNEIIVIGGHLDSISGWAGTGKAPGADDNASGSANVLEAMRIFATRAQAQRTTEFFFYAGEEGGLLGSAEIAAQYKSVNADVIAVLQLDMTLFPGEGELVIGNVEDFTSAWLRDYLVGMNATYIGARLVPDKCGYGCSDHASWFKNGYATLLPFEATTKTMNSNIHTPRDVIDGRSNFKHSVAFAKIAVLFSLDLANSRSRNL